MAGLFGWGEKDTMSKAERKAARENAEAQMRAQKEAGKHAWGGKHKRARRPGPDQPQPKGSLGW